MMNSTSPRPRLQGSITLPANKLVTRRRSSLAKQRSKLGRVDGAAEIEKAPVHIVVVECPVKRVDELVEDWL